MKNMKTLPPVAVGTAVALLGYSLITGGNLLREVWGGAKHALGKAAENKRGCRTCKGSRKRFNTRGGMGGNSQDEQTCRANGGDWIHGIRGKHPSYCNYGEDTLPKGGGIQNSLDGGVTFQSEYSVNQINPVEVEGAEDVYGAESVYPSPQASPMRGSVPSLKMW